MLSQGEACDLQQCSIVTVRIQGEQCSLALTSFCTACKTTFSAASRKYCIIYAYDSTCGYLGTVHCSAKTRSRSNKLEVQSCMTSRDHGTRTLLYARRSTSERVDVH